MARSFNGTTQYLQRNGAVRSALPCTLCAVFNISNVNTPAIGPSVYSSSGNAAFWLKYETSGIGWQGRFQDNMGYGCSINSGVTTTIGLHYVSCSLTAANTPPIMFVDGNQIVGTTYISLMSTIGCTLSGVGSYSLGGSRVYGAQVVSECAVYSSAWTNDQHIAFTRGRKTPNQISRNSLVAYWPLGGHLGQNDLDRWRNKFDLTAFNSPSWATHPPMDYPPPITINDKTLPPITARPWLYRRSTRIIGI